MSEQRPEKNGPGNGGQKRGAGGGRGPGGGSNGGMRFGRGVLGWFLFIGLAVMLFMFVKGQTRGVTQIDLSRFKAELENGKIKELVIEGDDIHGMFREKVLGTNGQEIEQFRTSVPSGN